MKPHAQQAALEAHELRAADARARLLSKREFDQPLALEAGAGTGKTATLVARVVCWTLGRGWRGAREDLLKAGEDAGDDAVAIKALEGVVAITFTEKAAAEMGDRCAQAFELISRGELPIGFHASEGENDWEYLRREGCERGPMVSFETLKQRAAALCEAPEHLSTRTIHAFCRALLARHPLEARLAPGFEVDADASRAEALAREVLELHLRDAWHEPVDEDVVALLTLGKGPEELEQALIALFAAGASGTDLAHDPFSKASLQRFCGETRARFEALRAAGLSQLAGLKFGRNKISPATLQAFAESEAIAARSSTEGPSSPEELGAWLEELLAPWNKSSLGRLHDWNSLHRTHKPVAEFNELQDMAPAFAAKAGDLHLWLAHARRIDVPLLGAARIVLGRLLNALEERMTNAGVASFGKLLSAASDLLRDRPEVRKEERRRMRLLLVDEFQDTDATQCAIVRELALKHPEEQRPALFLVGDPKQSIYGWRRADLAAYEEFLAEVEQAGGQRLPLAVNFRSYPAILDEVRRLIQPVMQRTHHIQPQFQLLLPRPGLEDDPASLPDDRQHVELWAAWALDEQSGGIKKKALIDESFAVEAGAIAADLDDLHSQGMAWKEAALLVRASTSIDPYLEALRARGIPFDVRGDKNYYRRREVVDAIALVRAVLDPNDHLALVALLRSPWVGVPDAAFGPLFLAGGQDLFARLWGSDQSLLDELRKLAGSIAQDVADVPGMESVQRFDLALTEAARGLGQARLLYGTKSAVEFVEGLRLLFLSEPLAAERYQGEWRLPNLARFYSDLIVALDESEGDAQAVVRRLRTDLANRRDAEEARPLHIGGDAVQIMTIHKAKGLDFEHVYLPQLYKGQRAHGIPAFAFERRGDECSFAIFGAPTLDFAEIEEHKQRTDAAERVRLLYVATTRARRRLVLLSTWDTGSDPRPWTEAENFAHLLAHREGGLEGLLGIRSYLNEAGDERHSCPQQEQGLIWRLAQRYAPGSEGLARDKMNPADGPAPPDLDQLLQSAQALIPKRLAALAHGQRPWRTRASDAVHLAPGKEHATDREQSKLGQIPEGTTAMEPEHLRAAALAAGTALHAGLEHLALDTPLAEAAAAVRQRALEDLERDATADLVAESARRIESVCDALQGGQLLGRLLGDRFEVIARELPVLVAPDADDPDGPVGYISGSIDLLLLDRQSDEYVIVDFKSDGVDAQATAGLAEGYGPQLRTYGRAIQKGLQLEAMPRLEAWFLGLDLSQPLGA